MSECDGCLIYRYYEGHGKTCNAGIPPKISDTLECPCRKCLVKTMCRTETCDEFTNYIDKVKYYQRRIFNKTKSDKGELCHVNVKGATP